VERLDFIYTYCLAKKKVQNILIHLLSIYRVAQTMTFKKIVKMNGSAGFNGTPN
jgi:hypothetical protein